VGAAEEAETIEAISWVPSRKKDRIEVIIEKEPILMEFITSRPNLLDQPKEMDQELRANMWSKKFWPYEELNLADTVYWYETISKCIVWKSQVVKLEKFSYSNKQSAFRTLEDQFGPFNKRFIYFENAPISGYCLAFRVKTLEKLSLPKPEGLKFPHLGWLRINERIYREWLK
jgi:hypothetical protein